MSEGSVAGILGISATILIVTIAGGAMYGCPQYDIYKQRTEGEAELARAEYSKRVQVSEAQGKLDAASKLADAEIARARGVAEANKIIGDSLKGNDAYLRYLWIDHMTAGKAPAVVYVPTEAGLPILEAGRRPQ